jgi:hypothetical protein
MNIKDLKPFMYVALSRKLDATIWIVINSFGLQVEIRDADCDHCKSQWVDVSLLEPATVEQFGDTRC